MKRLAMVLFVGLAVSASLPAQQASLVNFDGAALPAFLSPAASTSDTKLFPSLAVPNAILPATTVSSVPAAALPDAPRASYGGDGYRWDLGIGYIYVHFKSAPFSSNLSGLHTSVAYSLNDWFALEGSA